MKTTIPCAVTESTVEASSESAATIATAKRQRQGGPDQVVGRPVPGLPGDRKRGCVDRDHVGGGEAGGSEEA